MKTILFLLCAGAFFYISTKIILSRIKKDRSFNKPQDPNLIQNNPYFIPWVGNKYIIFALIAIWLFSLTLTGIEDGGDSSTPGYVILMIGIMGPLQGIFSWYANPCALFAIRYLFNNKFKEALYLSFASILLGLQAFMFQGRNISYIDSEGPFGTLAIGYYVWMLALVLLFILCLFNFTRTKNTPN
jgi:hypothetical protein